MKFGLYCRKSSEDSGKQIQSIEDQIQTLTLKAERDGFSITKIYSESKSAKKPGRREEFNRMIEDLKKGEIQGIICWKLDRLSRNQQEGGLIMQMLHDEVISKIITYEKTFYPNDNSLLMTIELGMATEYSRALSENTKRGQKFKASKGCYPSVAPLGYLNTTDRLKGTKEIEIDPERYSLLRKCWDLALEGVSVPEILRKSQAMGLKVPATRSKIEKPLSLNGLYKIFRNIFYTGKFIWSGKTHEGNHMAMISMEEFEKVQILIQKRSHPKAHKHNLPYTGLINCGYCGASITAAQKHKVRKDGSINNRTYYRCTRRKSGVECNQTSIRKEDLEAQLCEILDSISIPESFVKWAIKWLKDNNEESLLKEKSVLNQQKLNLDKIDNQLKRLLDLRLDSLIDDSTFKSKNEALMAEKRSILAEINLGVDSQDHRIEKTIELFELCKDLKNRFFNLSYSSRKQILDTTVSHWTLLDGKLDVELDSAYLAIAELKQQKWIQDSRFPTLPTSIKPNQEAEFNTEELDLIVNGGGDEELPLVSKNYSKQSTTSVFYGSKMLPFL